LYAQLQKPATNIVQTPTLKGDGNSWGRVSEIDNMALLQSTPAALLTSLGRNFLPAAQASLFFITKEKLAEEIS